MTNIIETPHSRRDFLKGSGALIVAFGLPLSVGAAKARGATSAIGPALVDPQQIDSWIAVGQNGRVTIFVGKVELGTGLSTAQAQIAADELDVALTKIDVIEGDTWRTPDQGTTSGSQSIKTQWSSGLRHAAAEARAALVAMAAIRLGEPADQLIVRNGVVSHIGDASKRVTYGELIGGRTFNLRRPGRGPPQKAGGVQGGR